MSQIIPITDDESQSFTITLNGQSCLIAIYTKDTGMYFDLTLNGTLIVSTMICLDRVNLVRYAYLGFIGNLAFIDTQGTADPVYTGLGSRYILTYFLPGEQ